MVCPSFWANHFSFGGFLNDSAQIPNNNLVFGLNLDNGLRQDVIKLYNLKPIENEKTFALCFCGILHYTFYF